jgi:serine/threonine-protein kinase HipA
MTDLAVDLYGRRIGNLVERPTGFDFIVDDDALQHHGIGSTVLSFSIPLSARLRPQDAPLRRNYFDEVLPEGRARDRLAGNARIAPAYTIGMLARYGRDVAGALQIWNPTAPDEPRKPAIALASPARVRQLLEEVRQAPIGNVSVRHLSSLAGVQDKIVIVRTADGWAEPLDGFPSTHIVKPVVPGHPSLIFDEEYGARIARRLGLTEFDTTVETFDGISALVIERYDRSSATPDGRIHQEDFNQALGYSGDGKYEEYGHPGLVAIARVLRENIGRDALEGLLRLTTMSVALGNLDMHAKNVSVLHLPDGSARLAPAYDVVPQVHLPFDKNFAFRVNGVFAHAEIRRDDLVAEGASWGIRTAAAIVDQVIADVEEAARTERPLPGAHHSLAEDIQRFCNNLATGLGASAHAPAVPASEVASPTESSGGWGGPIRA